METGEKPLKMDGFSFIISYWWINGKEDQDVSNRKKRKAGG